MPTAAATELVLTPGEIAVVGAIGHEGAATEVDRLGGLSKRQGSDEQVLFVSVEVEQP